jgi:hypothetical protein
VNINLRLDDGDEVRGDNLLSDFELLDHDVLGTCFVGSFDK